MSNKRKYLSSSSSDSDPEFSRALVSSELPPVKLRAYTITPKAKERWSAPCKKKPHFTLLLLQLVEHQSGNIYLDKEVTRFLGIKDYLVLSFTSKQRYFDVRCLLTSSPILGMPMATRVLLMEKMQVSIVVWCVAHE